MPKIIDHRYRIVRQLGQGATATVYLVEDRLRNGRPLALKLLHTGIDQTVLRREFEILATLRHPQLAEIFDIEICGAQSYITCSYIDGPDLATWASTQPMAAVLRALAGILRALCLLHDHGWVHGDLKQDNILVEKGCQQPRLVDFGLAVKTGHPTGGTAGYASPEQLSGQEATFRSDVYSFGVLMLEVLTGRRAFADNPATAVTRQMQGQSLLDESVDLAPPLSALLRSCLSVDPQRRPATALELLARLREAVDEDLSPDLDELDVLPRSVLVGRKPLLEQAQHALTQAAARRGSAVLAVKGAPGLGKSRFLEEVRFAATVQGYKCVAGENVRQILAELATLLSAGEASVPISTSLLAGLLPGSSAPGQAPSPNQLTMRLRAALFSLARDVAQQRPLLLLVDDCHRFEAAELEAIQGLARALTDPHPEAEHLPLVLAVTTLANSSARVDNGTTSSLGLEGSSSPPESNTDDPPRQRVLEPASPWPEAITWTVLEPIQADEAVTLVHSLLPGVLLDTDLGQKMWKLGAGNPWLIQESLLSWLRLQSERQHLKEWSADSWEVPVYPQRVLTIARQRLSGLSEPARHALQLLALSPELEGRVIHRLVPALSREMEERLRGTRLITERLRGRRLLWVLDGEHLRQTLLAELSADEKIAMHCCLATALQELSGHPASIAAHWEAAQEPQHAAEYYWRAAEEEFDYRGQWAQSAAQLGGPTWPHWAAARRSAARALHAAGERRQAITQLQEVITAGLAEDEDRAITGKLWVDIGNPHAALEILAETRAPLALLSRAQALLLLGLLDQAQTLARSLPSSADRLNLDGLIHYQRGELEQAAALLQQAEERYQQAHDNLGQAKAANNLAIVRQSQGDLDLARHWYQRAMELSRAAADTLRVLLCQMNLGTVCQAKGEFMAALQDYQRARFDARQLGSLRLEIQASINQATLLIELGSYDEAEQALTECPAGEETPNIYHPLNRADLAVAQQEFSTAEQQLQIARQQLADRDDPTAQVEALLVQCRLTFAQGRHRESSELAQQAAQLAETAGLDRLFDEARLAELFAVRRSPGSDLGRIKIVLEELCRRIEKRGELGRLWRVYHELSLVEALQGLEIEAGFHLAKAGQLVDAILDNLSPTLRQRLLERSEFREVYAATRNRPAASPQPSAAVEGARWDAPTLLRINTELARVRDPGELVVLILDKAIELTGAQRGLAILTEGDRLRIAAARNVDQESLRRGSEQFSKSVAREVIASGQSIITVDAQNDERFNRFESISAMRLRSVICTPLKIWGTIAGVIYLDNRFQQGAFTPHHVTLLEGFGAQAGLALDTARLLQQERQQIRALEQAKQKVEALTMELRQTIDQQSLALSAAEKRVQDQHRQLARLSQFEEIVGRSAVMLRIFQLIEKAAHTEIPVYIFGESGTGKELVARAIHRLSTRQRAPLVTINCGGLSPQLLASELFGHVKGAFTGAMKDHPGLIRRADQGTLFLDEVTEMSPELQVQLLRVLQTGDFTPVGGEREMHADVRVISASNLDIDKAVRKQVFREDLSYRLNVLRIDLPPLRQRREDIPLLVRHFLGQTPIAADALRLLIDYSWPGNVRELANELSRAEALAEGTIHVADLSSKLRGQLETPTEGTAITYHEHLAHFERQLLLSTLSETEGNASAAARRLGLSRAGLYKKMSKHGLIARSRPPRG